MVYLPMAKFGFLLLLSFSFVLFQSQGQQINLPPGGNVLFFEKESTDQKIEWTYTGVTDVQLRSWFFTSSDGKFKRELLAEIFRNTPVSIRTNVLEFGIKTPATLILKNINSTYNGTYTFELSPGRLGSDVSVFITGKPNVTINCSSPITVKEDHDLICLCKGENGNPSADVIWYDNKGNGIGQKEKEQKTLVLKNVTEANNGTYTCKAQSHTLMDEGTITVKVSYAPNKVDIHITKNPAIYKGKTKITCSSNGFPDPNFKITHNSTTNTVSTKKIHTISPVAWSDAGKYTCIAWNEFGNASASEDLSVKGQTPTAPTTPSNTSSKSPGTDVTDDKDGDGLGVGAIVGIVIGVLVLVVVIIGVVYYCKSKQRNGYKGNANVKPGDNGSEDAAENTYDTASGPSGSRTKPSKGDAPVVYSAVDKENRQGRPLYATLDEAAMRAPNNRKTPEEERPEPTQYASIEFGKTDEVPKADLV